MNAYTPPNKTAALQSPSYSFRAIAKASNNTIADDKERWVVPPHLDGAKIKSVRFSNDTAGITGTQTCQLHNLTKAVDVLSTPASIQTTVKRDDGTSVVNKANNTVNAGDELRVDVDAIHTGTAAIGLTCQIEFDL